MMELWASGFNAWGQLDFELSAPAAGSPEGIRDLSSFKCILRDKHIEIIQASLSAVLGKVILLLYTSSPRYGFGVYSRSMQILYLHVTISPIALTRSRPVDLVEFRASIGSC